MLRKFIDRYWKDLLILIPVMLVAAFLRLDQIRGYQVFLGDQGRDVLVVKRMIVDADPTFIGPNASVGGFFLGPLYYYLMVPPMILSGLDPVGPAVQVALFSLATLLLVYYYLKRYVCIAAALIGSAIYAVSVLVVEYARFSWNPNVLPFFAMLLILAWTKVLSHDTKFPLRWFALIGVMLGSVAQLHYAALALMIMSAFIYLLHVVISWSSNRKPGLTLRLQEIAMMVAGAIVILIPFIGFEIKNNFPNVRGIYSFVLEGRDDGFDGGLPFESITRDVTNRLFLRLVSGGDAVLVDLNLQRGTVPLTLFDQLTMENDFALVTAHELVWFIVIFGFVYGIYRAIAILIIYVTNTTHKHTVRAYLQGFVAHTKYRRQIAVFLVIASWWIFGVGWWGFYKKSIFDYYFSYMYPLPILTFAISCALLIHMYSRRLISANPVIRIGKLVLLGFVGLIVIVNLLRLATIFPGMQVDRTEWAVEEIIKSLGEGEYNFAVISDGNSDHAYRFFLEIKGYPPVSIDERVTDQLIVLCEIDVRKHACEPEGNSLWEVAGFGPAKIVGQSTAIGYPLYRLQHIEGEEWRVGNPAQKGD